MKATTGIWEFEGTSQEIVEMLRIVAKAQREAEQQRKRHNSRRHKNKRR